GQVQKLGQHAGLKLHGEQAEGRATIDVEPGGLGAIERDRGIHSARARGGVNGRDLSPQIEHETLLRIGRQGLEWHHFARPRHQVQQQQFPDEGLQVWGSRTGVIVDIHPGERAEAAGDDQRFLPESKIRNWRVLARGLSRPANALNRAAGGGTAAKTGVVPNPIKG
nr:hypothetical protein [Tanacetum cinerariifolium]